VATNANIDLILRNGRFTTLDRSNPASTAVAIENGRFVAVGSDADVVALASSATKIVDLRGRSALPGLIDNHLHIIRGGLNFNLELRWDGVRSLADQLRGVRRRGLLRRCDAAGARQRDEARDPGRRTAGDGTVGDARMAA